MRLINLLTLLLMTCVLVSSCASSDNSVPRGELNKIQTEMLGTIEQVTIVNVDGEQSWVGATTGSVAGSLLGSTIGSGWGRVASALVGSLAGNFAGRAVEEKATKTQGLQLKIQPDNGQAFYTIVVPNETESFQVGDRVKILISSSGNSQITHIQ